MDLATLSELIASTLHLPSVSTGPAPAAAPKPRATVRLCQRDPTAFWQQWLSTWRQEGSAIALADPDWPEDWSRQLLRLTDSFSSSNHHTHPQEGPAVLIPTGGSSGLPRFCIHDASTLLAAARGFAKAWAKKEPLHCVSFLPPYTVGGLLPVLRAAVQNETHPQSPRARAAYAHYRDPASLANTQLPLPQSCLSVVPTQLRRMIAQPDWIPLLRSAKAIFVGGAACPPDLLQQARHLRLPLSLAYGSTETAAMVASSKPQDFLAGANHCGLPLPHVRLLTNPSGCLMVQSPANLRAYLPHQEPFTRDPFLTSDFAAFAHQGHLILHGRADRVLISGGKNIHPETVEQAALQTGTVTDAAASPAPHPEWGQVIHLEVVPQQPNAFDSKAFSQQLRQLLPRSALPKAIHVVDHIQRHPVTGKTRPRHSRPRHSSS